MQNLQKYSLAMLQVRDHSDSCKFRYYFKLMLGMVVWI